MHILQPEAHGLQPLESASPMVARTAWGTAFEDMEELGSIAFLTRWGKGAAKAANEQFQPAVKAGDPIAPLPRPKYQLFKGGQAESGFALFKLGFTPYQVGTKTHPFCKTAFLTAEMGSGKTAMALDSIYRSLHEFNADGTPVLKDGLPVPKNEVRNWVIACPSIIVKKWIREIHRWVPGARTINANGADSLALFTQIEQNTFKGATFWVVGHSRNRMHFDYETHVVADGEGLACCPVCAARVQMKPVGKKEKGAPKLVTVTPAELRARLGQSGTLCCAKCNNKLVRPVPMKLVDRVICTCGKPFAKVGAEMVCKCGISLPAAPPADLAGDSCSCGGRRGLRITRDCNAVRSAGGSDTVRQDLPFAIPVKQCRDCGKTYRIGVDRTVSPAYYVQKKLKKRKLLDGVIVDEAHEIKGDGPQGRFAGALMQAAKRSFLLTGTLTGGYAENLWFLFWRGIPRTMRREGFSYRKDTPFIKKYGSIEERVTVKHTADGREESVSYRPRRVAGISAQIYTRFLMSRAIFMQLTELGQHLPSYTEHQHGLDMDEPLAEAYFELDRRFKAVLAQLKEDVKAERVRQSDAISICHNSMHVLVGFLDSLRRDRLEINIHRRGKDGGVVESEAVVVEAPDLALETTAKERKAIDIALEARSRGEKTLFYINYTDRRDCVGRLRQVLSAAGLEVGVLRAETVKAEHRDEWINAHTEFDVLICHPELVKTGLDLLLYPNIVFYQSTYNIYTLRQAARRSWRIGQTKDVNVHFLYYNCSIQETAICVIASNLDSALLAEGIINDSELFKKSSSRDSVLRDMAKAMLAGTLDSYTLPAYAMNNVEDMFAMNVSDFLEVAKEVHTDAAGAVVVELLGCEAPVFEGAKTVLATVTRQVGRRKVQAVEEVAAEAVASGTQLALFDF